MWNSCFGYSVCLEYRRTMRKHRGDSERKLSQTEHQMKATSTLFVIVTLAVLATDVYYFFVEDALTTIAHVAAIALGMTTFLVIHNILQCVCR